MRSAPRRKLPTAHCPLSTIHYPLSAVLCLLLAGCPRADSGKKGTPGERPLEGASLRLAVVDDPALAAAVGRVRGEWNAQTGASLDVIEATEQDLTRADALPADAVLCPSHLLCTLAERKLLAPVPQEIVRGAQWGGIFELLKLREAAWGHEIMAVPFGSPAFCCYYRADLLEKLGRRPPQTWADYEELARLFNNRRQPKDSPRPLGEGPGVRAPWCGAIEPLAPGWAGLTLLARAAASVKHRDNYSALFNIETMEPLISGPPWVQTLDELVAAAKLGPADPFRYDPAAARAAFWRGECGMALSWPTAAHEQGLAASAASKSKSKVEERIPAKPDPQIRVGFAELPGARRVFNLSGHVWDNRGEEDDPRVPLLAVSGRLGVVAAKSPHADAAFQLLLWLSDERTSPQVSAASPATTLFRQSNLKSPGQWVEKPVPAAAAVQYGDVTEAAFRHEQWLGALRLPGRAEYLAALDEAVAAAVRGDKSAQEALLEADAKWSKITDRLGRDRQKAAYRHSLGLE